MRGYSSARYRSAGYSARRMYTRNYASRRMSYAKSRYVSYGRPKGGKYSTGFRRRSTQSRYVSSGGGSQKTNTRWADILTLNPDGEVSQEVVGPGGTGVRCTHVTPLSLATERGQTLTGQKGIHWKGVGEHTSIEYAGSSPVLWRRIVFATSVACKDAMITISDDQSEECSRPSMVATTATPGKNYLRMLFVNPSRLDIVHAVPDVEGVRILTDEKFTYGNSSGFIKERKLWNSLGKVTYQKGTGNSCHDWSSPTSAFQNVYVMDILRCGFPGTAVKAEDMALDNKGLDPNPCAAPSIGTSGVAFDGVRLMSNRFRVYWYDSLA